MKKITLICMLIFNFIAFGQSNFDVGFKDGFKNAYCFTNNQSVYICNPPLPPLPPLPQINENRNSYQDGYNRGFLYGQARRRTDESNTSNVIVSPNNPPKFNPYVPQNPLLNLTPQGREAYYAAKARQEQESAQALGALLENIFTETPEGRARRAEGKAESETRSFIRKAKRDHRSFLRKLKQKEKKQAKYIIKNKDNSAIVNASPGIVNASVEFDFKSLPLFSGIINTDETIPVFDKPDSNNYICLGILVGKTITIIKKENDKYYLVKSGDITGYVFVGYIMKYNK